VVTVLCDTLSSRRTIINVRDMKVSEYDEFVRRSR